MKALGKTTNDTQRTKLKLFGDIGPGYRLNPNPYRSGMLALGIQGVPLWRPKETQEVIDQ
jgi:hypothetical protein